jgi:hypothetical protein
LVVSISRGRVEGKRARLAGASIRSIERAHREMADAIERMTGGRLRVSPTFRTVDVPIDLTPDEDEAGGLRFKISPDDLPSAVIAAVEPGAYDSVMFWAPIPLGFPRSALGVTYGGVLIGGATMSSGAIPSRQELRSNPGVPTYHLPLHEWWHQVEQRSRGLLGLGEDWPPRNHAPLVVDGQRLEPRDWISPKTTMDWYEHVLAEMPQAFWADVWGEGERITPSKDNLALRALPFATADVHWSGGLADTITAFGDYPVATERGGATDPGFGLVWPGPVSIGRIVAHTADPLHPERSAWTGATVEVSRSFDGDWTRVEAKIAQDGLTWTLSFPAVEAVRVRLRVEGEQPACRELEVYAE